MEGVFDPSKNSMVLAGAHWSGFQGMIRINGWYAAIAIGEIVILRPTMGSVIITIP